MRLALKIVGWVMALWALATIVIVAMNWSLAQQLWRFSPIITPAFYGEPADRAEAQAQDIRYLRRVLNYDRSFSDAEKAAFAAHLDAMAANAGAMSDAAFYMNVRKAMAISGNGHTGGPLGPSVRDFNRAGADFFWFADGLYIVRAHRPRADLVAARVVDIEGRTPAAVNDALAAYTGGAPPWRRVTGLYFLRSPALMHAAGLAAAPDRLRVTVEDGEGDARAVMLTALPPAGEAAAGYFRRGYHTLSAEALPEEAGDWARALGDKTDLPHYLRALDQILYRAELRADSREGAYLRLSYLMNRDGVSIKDELAAFLDAAPAGGYPFMAVDLRWNPGGNFDNAVEFAQQANDAVREGGKIYVIVGPQTFSAAIVFSALLKRYAPEKAMIVGEPMGDYGQFWAETGLSFKLPNSGYYIGYATGYHDWEAGCAGVHKYCFTRNAPHEGKIGSLAPQKLLTPTYEDYASGRDIVMDWVLEDAAQ